MRFIETFQLADYGDTVVSLTAAFVLGTFIGAERQYRERTAGLRTSVLVTVAAAAFVDLAMRISGAEGAVRVIAYVVAGVGFLGAGAIMKEGADVRGLTTAATMWCSAAVGACAGADMVAQAALLTVFVLVTNTLLRPLVNAINRLPINEGAVEATYEVRLTTDVNAQPAAREALVAKLQAAHYPVSDVEVVERSDDTVEIVAVLAGIAVKPKEIDAITATLRRQPGVHHAAWSAETVK
jgi:putative Mg2+ transporter-C (MgtC) family protein